VSEILKAANEELKTLEQRRKKVLKIIAQEGGTIPAKRGRKKGSKNAKAIKPAPRTQDPVNVVKRGRPKGSKNKPKETPPPETDA
jgi:hypothetical protein